jgi:hypothetical protein
LGAGPDDLSDAVGVTWKINADPPTAEIVLARFWHERLQYQTANLDLAIEKMGDSPSEIRRGKTLDEMRNEPEYKQLRKERILQGLDRGDLLRKAAVLAAQTGLIPGLPPELAAQLMQQHSEGGPGALQPGAPMGGAGGGAGAPMMPDQAALAGSPNGAGARLVRGPFGGSQGGQVPGAGQAQGPPQAGAQAMVQNIR